MYNSEIPGNQGEEMPLTLIHLLMCSIQHTEHRTIPIFHHHEEQSVNCGESRR